MKKFFSILINNKLKVFIFIVVLIFIALLFKFYLYNSKKEYILNYAKDNSRFIAHAGGQIERLNYTNSLEALENSYKNGFRMFELDIIKTSDGVFVAAHDWGKWKKITKYEGELPPSRKNFLNQKIHNKFTPMDIAMINDWFLIHLDAVLVTDKINEAKAFSAVFIDKQRLMMELFSWDSVLEGTQEGIKSAMPTGNLLDGIKGDKIKFLREIGVTDIAMSRKKLTTDMKLIQQINSSGIKIFAFHINDKKGRGVNHVVCKERKYFYGMYANKWSQNYLPNCEAF